MAYIFLNLKRFDISPEKGGVNSLCPIRDWASTIVKGTSSIKNYPKDTFAAFFPEAHLMNAARAKAESGSPLAIGCQGCYMEDIYYYIDTHKDLGAYYEVGNSAEVSGHPRLVGYYPEK